MKPNTVILGWPYGWRQSETDRTWKTFLETCRVVTSSRMALVIPKGINFFPDSTEKVRFDLENRKFDELLKCCNYSRCVEILIFGGLFMMEVF